MGVRFRCGTQDSKELRLNFLAVISFSVSETKIRVRKVIGNNYQKLKVGGEAEVK
jgi:hypothetical protein